MHARRRFATAVSLALLLAVGVAACGGSSSSSGASSNGVASESADAILSATTKAADALKSVHVAGTVKDDGKLVTLALDLESGVGSMGYVALAGHKVQLVTVGDKVYLNGGAAFWKAYAGGAAASLLAGRWLEAPGTGSLSGIDKLGNVTDLFNGAFGSHGALAKAGQKTIRGIPAVGVRDTSEGGVVYVATTGKPYPLEVIGTDKSTGDKLTFTDFNAPVKVTAPSGAVNLGSLEPGS